MRYIELVIKSDRAASEIVQAVCIDAGFTSMQIDDPLDAADIASHPESYKYDYINETIEQKAAEAGLDDAVVITLYFADDEEGHGQLQKAKSLLEEISEADEAAELELETRITGDESEWLYKWQEHFKPAKVGERVVVKPGWEEYNAKSGELVIEMDPGMAFGSGLHETTSMCVKALEKYMPADARVLDVGTGTGILAMAAVLLGAEEALGIDIDEEAIRVSSENIGKNRLSDKIRVMQGDLMAGVEYSPDVIVANLMADLVMMLSPAAAAQIKPGGIYITSGILDIKENAVAEAVRSAGFGIREVLADGEWRAIVAVKKQ